MSKGTSTVARWGTGAALVMGCFLTAGLTVSAQEVTGTLYGTVTGEDGARLPGVTITVTSRQLIGGSDVRVTGDLGTYRAPALPPGTYTLTAELPGFQPVRRENIVLQAGAVLAVDFKLQIAAVQETVSVTGEAPLVDVRSTQTTRTVDNALIENTPVGRSFAELVTLAPGVVDSEYSFAPAQTVHGGSVRDNVSNVDGANINDNTVGYTFTDLPFDMIDEVQVTSGGISAEFGQASGAVFNFITKSGGNSFSGGGSATLRGRRFEGNNLSDELVAQGLTKGTGVVQHTDYSLNLGGPIRRDKVWFFGLWRAIDIEQTNPEFPVRNPEFIDRQGFVKVTAQLARKSRLQGSYTHRSDRTDPSNASFRTVDAPESWTWAERFQKIMYLALNQTLSDSSFAELSIAQTLQHTTSGIGSDTPGYQEITTGVVYGGWTGPQQNYPNREQRSIKANFTQFKDDFLWGSHNFKVGYQTEYAPLTRDIRLPEDMYHLMQRGEPYRVRLYNTPILQARHVNRHAAFVQDAWTLGRWTVNLGLRFERSEGFWPEQEGGGGRWDPVTHYGEVRNAVLWKTVAPRAGLVWNVRGDNRTSVKVSLGRYYAALLNQYMDLALRNRAGFREFDWIDRNRNRSFENGEQGVLRTDQTPSRDFYDPNLKNPYTDTLHVGFDQQLGSNFALAVTGIFKRDRDILETVDVGRPFSAYNPINVVNPITGEPITIYALDRSFLGVQRVLMLTNPTDPVRLKRNYQGVEILAHRRLSDGWGFQASLNLGRSRGNIGNSFGASVGGSNLYLSPNSLINIDGPLDLDTPMQLKLLGTYVAPAGIVLSGYYTGISGFAIRPPGSFPTDILGSYTLRYTRRDSPQIVVEPFVELAGVPRGTHRIDFRHKVALRAEKQFPMPGSNALSLVADVFNLLNINTVTFVQSLQFGHPKFLKPAVIEQPRSLQLTIRYRF